MTGYSKQVRNALDIGVETIRDRHCADRWRTEMGPAIEAVDMIAFIQGTETTWLLDPSIPLTEAFKEYAEPLARECAPTSGT
jgi:hypothetical protein